ncbi:hypothetical protein DM02DRAFT_613848 [Periconia macrospinosa]|uniref:GAT domain-containing protein n=1 Tax=Periconia macrospinosa TaxID=97972 RepID=A0A2V1DVF7_9PLEO|nr:hypothetical protein DM02DRAFT_613848 [Periconia macrospinosa]
MVLKKRLTNLGSLIKRQNSTDDGPPVEGDADTPEANVARGVRSFCESGAANSGEEVLHLPTIVESAVASPGAAASAATQIRKFLSKENYDRPHAQYNAVMLIRILADNPGPSFTKNLDKSFADTVKHLLRNGRDPSVAQILRETLDALEKDKAYDTNLNAMFAMWKKERQLMANAAKSFGPRTMNAPPWSGQHQPRGGHGGHGGNYPMSNTLPPPIELASRIEEARTSAKLLLQLVQSTSAHELLGNDLVKEFSERCIAAQRSIQAYINCDNPAPDDDTMLTLIETNEQLSLAASKHQRAILQARRALGASPSPPVPNLTSNPLPPIGVSATYTPPQHAGSQNEAPILPPLNATSEEQKSKGEGPKTSSSALPLALQVGQKSTSRAEPDDDPFADHHSSGYTAPAAGPPPRRVDDDDSPVNGYTGPPYNPGFQSTPSYLGRQESSANNLTMHGAGQPPVPEEGNGTREDAARKGAAAEEQSKTHGRVDSDVSPITERATVTYRY